MLLSILLHLVAALSLAAASALTLHFLLLVPFFKGGLIGLLIYFLFFAFTWLEADTDMED